MNCIALNQNLPQSRWLLLCALLLVGACSEQAVPDWSGYAEADYVYVAAPLAGQLKSIGVQAGQNVVKGAVLFALDAQAENAARAEAEARLASARAQATNTDKGRRSDEIAVTQAQLDQASANATLAQTELARQQQLVTQGFISKSRLDDASSAASQAQARVAELKAALRVANLPARVDERVATRALATAAQEALRQSLWREAQKEQSAPVDGLVSEIFFRTGEFVPAGQPVLALLPAQNLKARFFVPEVELTKVALGQSVVLRCDGCAAPIAAHIVRIASEAEYTPPVIYSNSQRSRLVFMVEARPDVVMTSVLRPGQPLQVRAGVAAKP